MKRAPRRARCTSSANIISSGDSEPAISNQEVSICPGMDGSKAMQEQLPRSGSFAEEPDMELPVKSRKAAGQALAEALQVYKECFL